ncbi:MAG: alkaline phosphatase D family protein [Planctomycetaceae bacterium]
MLQRIQSFQPLYRWLSFGVFLAVIGGPSTAFSQKLGMGVRIGELTQHSAILWTRLTKNYDRNDNGFREPKKRERRQREYVPSPIKVEERQGEMPGMKGQVRYTLIELGNKNNRETPSKWITVNADQDFIHQFQLKDLKAGYSYNVEIEARGANGGPVTDRAKITFRTPLAKNMWQDVRFTVVTGQSYWDLDHPKGYHIYPAMAKLNPHFLVATGDTVYLDSEAPRARTIELARYHWHRMYSLPRHIAFHRKFPCYWEVDDHDAWVNDCWPSMKAPWMNPLTFKQGFNIYREQVPMGKKTYRTIRWGSGLQIWLVEGRLYRSPNNMKDGPAKTIWGKEQLAWLKKSILESDATFKVLISPTPIVGPDRARGKNDNHSNKAFAYEGNHFRNWTRENKLTNFFVCCGDRHWQYVSIDPKTQLHEFSCGPASNKHAGGSPGRDPLIQPFLRQKGGFLSVTVGKENGKPTILFRHHDVHGKVVYTVRRPAPKK